MRQLLLLLTNLLLISCTPNEPLYNTQTYVFGTLVDISIYGESDEKAQAVATKIIHQYNDLHQRLHAWKPSELSTINQAFASGQTPITVEPDIAKMIADIAFLSSQSKGAFNPAIGQLIQLWGFQNDTFSAHKVDTESVKSLVAKRPQMSDIVINSNQIHSTNPSVQLDLGGYAKGYALDMGVAYLKQRQVNNALINIGGNIIALGQKGEQPWRVGIQHPRQPNAIATIALPSGWAIGTSGDYQRYFVLDGKRYCHVIDPSTGYPAQGMQSVTVLIPPQANAGVLSDVASKPIFIATANARVEAAKSMGVKHFLVMADEQDIQVSDAMQKRLSWLDTKAEKQLKVIQLD
ncbi:MAG: FAD:protein FMN transferase [Betaproteobacteria bacterium]|nr:FAD:protein FMN transferase [Betaproteobacteria bacterium]